MAIALTRVLIRTRRRVKVRSGLPQALQKMHNPSAGHRRTRGGAMGRLLASAAARSSTSFSRYRASAPLPSWLLHWHGGSSTTDGLKLETHHTPNGVAE